MTHANQLVVKVCAGLLVPTNIMDKQMKSLPKSHTLLLVLVLCLSTLISLQTLEKNSCFKISVGQKLEIKVGLCNTAEQLIRDKTSWNRFSSPICHLGVWGQATPNEGVWGKSSPKNSRKTFQIEQAINLQSEQAGQSIYIQYINTKHCLFTHSTDSLLTLLYLSIIQRGV